jgi:hypothetical protein
MPGAFAKVMIQPSQDGIDVLSLSHSVCNGMINANQYHYSIESILTLFELS